MQLRDDEGAAFRPVPLTRQRPREAVLTGRRMPSESSDLRCEMCFAPVIASHCKRICLRCGFMTGCSEGL
jgi:hypothetical protein